MAPLERTAFSPCRDGQQRKLQACVFRLGTKRLLWCGEVIWRGNSSGDKGVLNWLHMGGHDIEAQDMLQAISGSQTAWRHEAYSRCVYKGL